MKSSWCTVVVLDVRLWHWLELDFGTHLPQRVWFVPNLGRVFARNGIEPAGCSGAARRAINTAFDLKVALRSSTDLMAGPVRELSLCAGRRAATANAPSGPDRNRGGRPLR